MFPIVHIRQASVRLDNISYPPTAILFFSSTNCPRITTTTCDDVALILIIVFNHKRMMMEHCILCQPNLHRLYGLKYNTLSYNDIVMINERHTVIEPKTISYSPMCLTQVPTIWHLWEHVPPMLTTIEPYPFYLTQELVDHQMSHPHAHPQMPPRISNELRLDERQINI
jgi:hypothetical protein